MEWNDKFRFTFLWSISPVYESSASSKLRDVNHCDYWFTCQYSSCLDSEGGDKEDNLNVKSAFLHVLGDMHGSVGAIETALVIFFFWLGDCRPNWLVLSLLPPHSPERMEGDKRIHSCINGRNTRTFKSGWDKVCTIGYLWCSFSPWVTLLVNYLRCPDA